MPKARDAAMLLGGARQTSPKTGIGGTRGMPRRYHSKQPRTGSRESRLDVRSARASLFVAKIGIALVCSQNYDPLASGQSGRTDVCSGFKVTRLRSSNDR